jgi:hypothetical protein
MFRIISKIKFSSLLLAVLLLGSACTPAAKVGTQRATEPSTNDNQVFSNPLAFSSTLEVTEFIVENAKLVAVGFFTVTDFEGNMETVPASVPVNGMTANSACSVLTVTLGPLDLEVLGMLLNADTLQFVTVTNPEKGFSEVLLCGIVDAFNNADLDLVAMMLNEVLALFGWS